MSGYVRQWPLWLPLLIVIVATIVFFVAGKDAARLTGRGGTVAALAAGILIGPRK